MTEIEFLKARLDEREAAARAALHAAGKEWSWSSVDYNSSVVERHGNFWGPEAVLAQITALRRIIRDAEEAERQLVERGYKQISFVFPHRGVIHWLVQPYAGRDDFPAEWKA